MDGTGWKGGLVFTLWELFTGVSEATLLRVSVKQYHQASIIFNSVPVHGHWVKTAGAEFS